VWVGEGVRRQLADGTAELAIMPDVQLWVQPHAQGATALRRAHTGCSACHTLAASLSTRTDICRSAPTPYSTPLHPLVRSPCDCKPTNRYFLEEAVREVLRRNASVQERLCTARASKGVSERVISVAVHDREAPLCLRMSYGL